MKTQNFAIALDLRSGVPIYLQIVEQVRQRVTSGALRPGDQLPTVRQMATELRVNFNTIARAYRLLDEAGLISTQQGRGTYIWEGPTEEKIQQLKQKNLEELAHHFLEATSQMGYSLDEAIQALRRVQADGLPAGPVEMQDESEDKEI